MAAPRIVFSFGSISVAMRKRWTVLRGCRLLIGRLSVLGEMRERVWWRLWGVVTGTVVVRCHSSGGLEDVNL